MTDARHRSFWHRTGPFVAIGSLVVVATAQGSCSDDTNTGQPTSTATSSSGSGSTSGTGGSGGTGGTGGGACNAGPLPASNLQLAPAATGDMTTFSTPFDATPSPTGDTVYFTAIGPTGPGVFRAPAAGAGGVTTLYVGPLLTAPFNIATSTDGQMLFITDTGAEDGTNDAGRIFTLPNDGGMPAPLTQADAFKPRAIEIHAVNGADMIYFTGTNAAGESGIFTMPAAGGMVTEVAKGTPFVDPSGIAIAGNGDAYVCDTQASGTRGSILAKYTTEPVVATIAKDLGVGYPCGVALSGDDASLFVSGIDPATGKDLILKIATTAPNTVTTQSPGDFEESAGLHRAKCANVFAWADSKANAGGTVFVLQP
jgi:hypothetical protein